MAPIGRCTYANKKLKFWFLHLEGCEKFCKISIDFNDVNIIRSIGSSIAKNKQVLATLLEDFLLFFKMKLLLNNNTIFNQNLKCSDDRPPTQNVGIAEDIENDHMTILYLLFID